MSDDRIVISSGFALSPETVANRNFAAAFRGYDQAEVRVFLKRVADDLTAAAQREAELRRSLQEALTRAAHPELDEAVLTNALGEHTARLLTNAREMAAAMVSDAETRAARILQEGEGRIARMRAEAETLLARRAEEAERLAAGLRQAAESDARTLRERARADAQAEIETARAQGREMVAEAKELRERMLADLLRRRRMAEAQIEELRRAHQRLLEAYGVVRRTLDEATGELSAAEAETRPVLEAIVSRAEAQQGYARAGAEPAPHRRPPHAAPEFHPAPLPEERDDVGAGGESPVETAETSTEHEWPPVEQPEPVRSREAELEPEPEPEREPEPVDAWPEEPSSRPPAGEVRDMAAEALRRATASRANDPGAPTEHPGGLAALGAGAVPVEGERPGSHDRPQPSERSAAERVDRRERRRRPGKGRRRQSLPPIDIAAPGEEVRVVHADETAPAAAEEAAAVEAPISAKEGEEARPASTHVEELFARLRAAQQRRDAAESEAVAPPSDASTPSEASVESPPAGVEATPSAAADHPQAATQQLGGQQVADEKALYRRDELLDPIDTDLSRRLKRVLQDEQNEVLDRLRRQRRPVAEATLPDLIDQTERYRSAAAPLLREAAQKGAAFAAATGAVAAASPDATDASADGWAADLAIELVTPLRERLERALGEAAADVDADATVAEHLSASYRQWKLQQIEVITRHYSSAAFTRGLFAATAHGTALRWVVDDDGPCPDCDDNALAGPTPKGEAFPTGQIHPPAHPGCRCLLMPIGV